MPRMSVNWSRNDVTCCLFAASRSSRLVVMKTEAVESGRRRARAEKVTALPRPPPPSLSGVVIQEELVRMRAQCNGVHIFDSLHLEPGVDEILREDSAFEQERMVGLQGLQRLEETSRRVLDVLPLFRLQLVQVHVHRLRRPDLVLDAVEAGPEHRRERDIRGVR